MCCGLQKFPLIAQSLTFSVERRAGVFRRHTDARSSAFRRHDLLLIHDCAVDWALVGNFQKSLSLWLSQVTVKLNEATNAIDLTRLVFASFAIAGVDAIMGKFHRDTFQVELLVVRIHPKCHGCTGSQRSQQEIVGRHTQIVSARHTNGLVCDHRVMAGGDILSERPGAFCHHNGKNCFVVC